MQDCASSNKIKENKYKILRMSLILGSDDDREETINNFEEAARDIDSMNDEIYLKDLEDKFYDTLKLEEEEKKLAVLVDYIGGRVEQRISLLRDFANITGYDLDNLPPIKYYDKLDDYKERLKYIREYLKNTEQIDTLNKELEVSEENLKEAYKNKGISEECNIRNEDILFNKFTNIMKSVEYFKEINENNIDSKLNDTISIVQESKKSLDIFKKSFTTLSGSGISYEEEQEYKSYVDNAKEVYYTAKEQEYLLRIYQFLLKKEVEYNKITTKRENINDLLYERTELRKELNIESSDILTPIYSVLERQYEDIKKQKENIELIETLNTNINNMKEQLNELELDNQKVEILSLLREFCMIETYTEVEEQEPNTSSSKELEEPTKVDEPTNLNNNIESSSNNVEINNNCIFAPKKETPKPSEESSTPEKEGKENQVIKVENATNVDLELIHAKANKVMKRVGEMLGIKTEETKIISVSNPAPISQKELPKFEKESSKTTIPNSPLPAENPLFQNNITPEITSDIKSQKEESSSENNFWFPSDTPDALNDLPDLSESNDNFFASSNIPDLNFPDLKVDFGNNSNNASEGK